MRGLFVRNGIIVSRAFPGTLGPGTPQPPAGYVFLTDDDGVYLTDDNGVFLVGEADG